MKDLFAKLVTEEIMPVSKMINQEVWVVKWIESMERYLVDGDHKEVFQLLHDLDAPFAISPPYLREKDLFKLMKHSLIVADAFSDFDRETWSESMRDHSAKTAILGLKHIQEILSKEVVA